MNFVVFFLGGGHPTLAVTGIRRMGHQLDEIPAEIVSFLTLPDDSVTFRKLIFNLIF